MSDWEESKQNFIDKLKSREFTVAIVGLEKAGKSTPGNALINSMVLPEYAARCTYTTTEIRAGDTDVAEVYFYSRDVIIRSTQLADMSHIFLYDVPGFDSPTELHKRQTKEMLKEADAIILLTNAGSNPDLVGTQPDMLRKGQDSDGVKLSEKSFVFGNKIERASNFKTARDNLAVLKNDAVNNAEKVASKIL